MIAVIYGGRSAEHDVSIITGIQIMHLLEGEDVMAVYIDRNGVWKGSLNQWMLHTA